MVTLPWRTNFSSAQLSSAQFSSVQSLSHVQLFATSWTVACQASLSITNSRSLHKLMSIESVMPSSHFILCCPLLLPPSIFPSIREIGRAHVFGERLSCCCMLGGISSVQSSCSVMSDSLRPHRLQHPRPPCPSPTPGAYPDSCPLSR